MESDYIMYKKTVWENNVTPLNSDNMNKIEDELESQSIKLDTIPDDIANELKDVSHFKGTIDSVEKLPIENVKNGDMYYSIAEEVLAIAVVKENVTTWYETAELPKNIMTFKAITPSSNLPTENVNTGDTYYLLDKNVFAVAYVYEGNVTWFKSAVEVPAYLDLSKTMSFKGVRLPQQGLPIHNVYYGDTYFVGNGPTDVNGYYAVALVADGNVTWFKTQSITVDSELSPISKNPVQNKTILTAINNRSFWQKAANNITIEEEAESQAITLNGNYYELVVRIEYPADTASSAANGQIEYKVTNASGTVTTIGVDSLNKGAKYILTTISNVMGNVFLENNSLQYKEQASTASRTTGVEVTTNYLNNLTISIPTDGWKLKVGTTIKIYGKRYYS